MEYILINEKKLKVMLCNQDLDCRALEAEKLDYSLPEAKKLFCDILGYAKDKLGFDTSGYRVLLQLYPSKDGGCELFITRLGKPEASDPSDLPPSSEKESDGKAKEIQKKARCKKEKAFSFDKLSHLIDVCKRLGAIGIDCESSVYSDGERWYLLLYFLNSDIAELSGILPLSELSFIGEYGSAEDPRPLSLYLCEYANEICQGNAIDIFSRM